MSLTVEVLSEEHKSLISKFSCVETDEYFKENNITSKEKRRILKGSHEIDNFLKKEALKEQNQMLNTTHLLIETNGDGNSELIGFISLCNDSLRLAEDDKHKLDTIYAVVPAIKIARIGVSNTRRGVGYAKFLLRYCLYQCLSLLKISGCAYVTLDCYQHKVKFYEHANFEINPNCESQKPNQFYSMRRNVIDWLNELSES